VTGLAAEFGVAATPGGVGGTIIRLVFMKKSGVPIMTGASILTSDAVLDVSFFIILIPFALIVMGRDPSWNVVMDELRNIPLGIIIAGVILLVLSAVILFRKGGRWARGIEGMLKHIKMARKRRLAGRLRFLRWKTRNALVRILATTKFMFQQHVLALTVAFVLTGIQWLCRYGILPVILMAFSGVQNILPLLVMQGLFLVLSFVILLPGGGGTVEMITTLVLRQFVPISAVGIVLILWRFFTYHLYLLMGGTVFFLTWGNLERILPSEQTLRQDRD
ncbi:MAG: flippase-like domain-containing protein, partial [Kiritimatiellae bacterium]|nr:flippase-like domain-containing protein [Kiritimatiellia bacterium]